MSRAPGPIWVQGAGELASGVIWRLVRCGYRVIAAEIAAPLAVRRRVCFSEAIYEGTCTVEGVPGRRVAAPDEEVPAGAVAVVPDARGEGIATIAPRAIVDARMTKREPEALPAATVPVIGLGPGFEAPRNVRFVIETHRLARLGEVIERGKAAPNTGTPGPVGGRTRARVVRAPAAGRLEPEVRIGDLVEEGQVLGRVAGRPVVAGLAGRVRGLIHPGVELSPGTKVGDVDPRGPDIDPDRISDKALAVAGGVLEALLRLKILPPA